MKMRDFIAKLINASGPVSKLLQGFSEGEQHYTIELIELIKEAIKKEDAVLLEYVLIVADKDGLNKSYTAFLCQLLAENWHHSHEDIVMLLEKIKDPESVDCIYNASSFVIDYDDGRSLAKKCIWALGAINTEYSMSKLEQLSHSDNIIIKEAAIMQINQIKAN